MKGKHKVERSVLWHRASRVLKWVPMVFAAVLIISFALGQVPKIQTGIINEITDLISKNTSFRLTVGHANLTWYDEMRLRDIRLYHKASDSTMIAAEEMNVDFSLIGYMFKREIIGDRLSLKNPYVHIIKENDSSYLNINLFVTELKQIFKKSPKKKTSISIDEIAVEGGIFSFNNLGADSLHNQKDFSHFTYDSLQLELSDFIFQNDSIGFEIISLSGRDPHLEFPVHRMSSVFSFTSKNLTLEKLDLAIGKSQIADHISLNYARPGDLKYFVDSIEFNLNFSKTFLSKNDLKSFHPDLGQIASDLQLSGQFNGTVKKLELKEIDLKFGSESRLVGSGTLDGLPYIDKTFINFQFDETAINTSDLKHYLPEKIDDKISKLGRVTLDGTFIGYQKNFTSKGSMVTDIGNLHCDLKMKIADNNRAIYTGDIELNDFQANILFPELDGFRNLTLNGHLDGQGLDINTAKVKIDAQIESLAFREFGLTNIHTTGQFEKAFLDANFQINDPKLKFIGLAELDLRNDQNKFKISADIESIQLQSLGLSKQPLDISSKVEVDMKGLRIDDMDGFVHLYKSRISSGDKNLLIDSLSFLSSQIGNNRLMSLNTDGLSMEINGAYKNRSLISGVSKLFKELLMNIKNNSDSITNYYAQSSLFEEERFDAILKIKAKDLNKFITPFYPNISISKGVEINGKIKQDSIIDFSVFTKIDSIVIGKKSFVNNTFDLSVSKNYYKKDVLSSVFLKSNQQTWSETFKTESLHTEFIWQKDHVDIWSHITQNNLENTFEINSSIHFLKDQTQLSMQPSNILIFGNRWRWNPNNSMTIQGSDLAFNDFVLASESESIEVKGSYALNSREAVNLIVREFSLANLKPLFPLNLEGSLDGNIKINREKGPDRINLSATARGVKMNNHLFGNVFMDSNWDPDKGRINSSLKIVKNEEEQLDMVGFYDFQNEPSPLNFNLNLSAADVKLLTPLVKNIFSNLEGSISGESTISGTLNQPHFKGQYAISQASLKVNYLNTTYGISGPISMNDKVFSFNNFQLIDQEGHQGLLNGDLTYQGDKQFELNLAGTFENFKLLNTNATDNDLYYGQAYGTGEIYFTGTNQNMHIKSQAKTAKGTRLSFPIDQHNEVESEQKEYIQFVNLSEKPKVDDALVQQIQKETEKIKGLVLDLDIEMTNDAYVEMIFDVKAGDIIRGRGNGNIDFLINTEGDFTMLGDYIIESGGYNFTLYNIINKEFEIQKGSSISWFGDPYGATLNINAQYRQLASLSPILTDLDDEDRNSAELRKKYPTIVALNLTDDLLTPTIKFDIDIKDYPTTINLPIRGGYPLEDQVNAFKTKIKFNEQEMNRQVFSLVILRKFSSENGFEVNSETIGSSISEFVSNQLSYWATQVDENLEIDVDLATLDQDAFNTFQLRLSYTFLDGRLKVTRGGGLPNDQNRDDIYAIIGDWTVEYLLTEDGRFRAKIYSRSDLNTIDVESGQNNIETGFSLQFVRSFDDLSQILNDSRNKNIKKNTTSTTN